MQPQPIIVDVTVPQSTSWTTCCSANHKLMAQYFWSPWNKKYKPSRFFLHSFLLAWCPVCPLHVLDVAFISDKSLSRYCFHCHTTDCHPHRVCIPHEISQIKRASSVNSPDLQTQMIALHSKCLLSHQHSYHSPCLNHWLHASSHHANTAHSYGLGIKGGAADEATVVSPGVGSGGDDESAWSSLGSVWYHLEGMLCFSTVWPFTQVHTICWSCQERSCVICVSYKIVFVWCSAGWQI